MQKIEHDLKSPAKERLEARRSLEKIAHCLIIYCTLLSLFAQVSQAAENPPAQIEFFENKIRPILAQECYECHSSTGKKKGGLVLDFRDGLLEGGDTGPAIEPGDADTSLLMEALRHEFDLEMPKAGVKLDPPIVADFEKWINMGAPDPRDHPPTTEQLEADTNWSAIFKTRQNWWSFQPVKNPTIPDGKGTAVDRFIRTELRDAELKPAPPAAPRTLARRLHYALTGLPASVEALDKFEQNPDTNQLIDELLASSQFGERWARHWMDWVRYAESHGSEGDPGIDNAHLYRDYLIRALNSDIPYDQLLREHIAGDLLKNPRINETRRFNESTIGAIHWRMVFHGFAPTDALDEKVRFTDDQINTFTKAFQGLTVSCARCHDHKFDAISQADYYALFGILGSTRPGRKLIDLPETLDHNKTELAALKPKIRVAIADHWLGSLDELRKELLSQKNWPKGKTANSLFHPFYLLDQKPEADAARLLDNLAKSATDTSSPKISYGLTTSEEAAKWFKYGNGITESPAKSGDFLISHDGPKVIEQILPAGMYSGLLSTKHAGRLTSADITIRGKSSLLLLVNGDGQALNRYVVQNYPRSGTVFKIDRLGQNKKKDKPATRPEWRWKGYNLDYWAGDKIHVELATAQDTAILVDKTQRSWFGIREARIVETGAPMPNNIGKEFYPAITASIKGAVTNSDAIADAYVVAVKNTINDWKAGTLDDSQALLLDELIAESLLPNQLSLLPKTAKLIEEYRKLESEIIVPTRIPGSDEWTAADQPLYDRGDHKKPLEPVSRRYIEAVDASPYETKESGRLQMAADLLRKDNPFTRRVIVNRVWTHLFGNGIVGSVDNFGRLGEKPSHPELLDYLATRFSDDMDWSIKSLVKEIVSSETWQQSSNMSEQAKAVDPENRLLSHFPIRRLEAEAIRDKLITVSGMLDETMYGPAVAGGSNRRSVYVQVIRNRLDEFLGVFDAPIPFSTTGKRPVTNVPAQSLTMLNDPKMKQFSTSFSAAFTGSDEQRIGGMWEQALGREPNPKEFDAAQRFLENLRLRSEEVANNVASLRSDITSLNSEQNSIIQPARKKLEEAAGGAESALDIDSLGAVASWDFERDVTDTISEVGGKLTGDARIENGSLIVSGDGSFFSDPLPMDIKEKTLEVLVTLDTLDQRAGGAITIQDLRGGQFDSIVFAERRKNEWLSGSNNHTRTLDFGGKPESKATDEPVHLVLAYDSDGTVRGYRNGEPYGKPYKKNGIAQFKKDQSQIVLGLRHGTGNGGNRNLKGMIHLARIYNQALDEDSIASLATGKLIISKKAVIESLPPRQQIRYGELQNEITPLKAQLNELQKEGGDFSENQVWQSFAHSLFNLKEFIYVY